MGDLFESNLREIELLNQRGGRTLSVVDLIRAGTLTPDLAAFMLAAVRNGASFMTGAVPGGAGKSTVLATLLAFLPPDERIVCVSSPSVVDHALEQEDLSARCFLPHEIGSGPYYGYLWGRAVARWVSLADRGARPASCLHADTLGQMHSMLTSRELGVPPDGLAHLHLCVFIHVARGGGGIVRRVAEVCYRRPGERVHDVVFRWDPQADRIVQVADPGLPGSDVAAARAVIDSVLVDGVTDFAEVMWRLQTSGEP